MGRPRNDDAPAPTAVPLAHPEPGCTPGYAEDRPADKAQARIPGARPQPDAEEGDLEHDPDPRP